MHTPFNPKLTYSELHYSIQGLPLEDLWVLVPLIEMADPLDLQRLGIQAVFDGSHKLISVVFLNDWQMWQMVISLMRACNVKVTYFGYMYTISTKDGRDLLHYPPKGKFLDKQGKVTDVPPPHWKT